MHDLALIIHLIGLTMSVGAGFANLFLGIAASKLEPAERGKFMANTMILMRMGQTGFVLLILSGFYLMRPYWQVIGEMPTLIAKLSLVGVLVILVTMLAILATRAQKQGNPALLVKLRPFGILNFLIGVTIVVMAVLSFH